MYLIIDTETTGLDPERDRVCEIACLALDAEGKPLSDPELSFNTLVNSGIPIPPEASAIHHITDAMLTDAPTWERVQAHLTKLHKECVSDFEDCYFVAHNSAFDHSFVKLGAPTAWICTYRLARHLWADAPAFSNQALRYWLGLCTHFGRDAPMHQAWNDTAVTAELFARELALLKEMGLTEPELIARFAQEPVFTRTPGFGKHRDAPWAEVPGDYLDWMQGKDWDRDTQFSLDTELARRRAKQQGVVV